MQRADELEAEWEVLRCGDEAQGSKGDLHNRIDERAQGRWFARLGFAKRLAVCGNDTRPEVKGMNILPVVNCFV